MWQRDALGRVLDVVWTGTSGLAGESMLSSHGYDGFGRRVAHRDACYKKTAEHLSE